MISREYAEKLQEVVKWEPKFGDKFFMRLGDGTLRTREVEIYRKGDCAPFPEEDIWLPSLDQLLEMIEAEGYRVDSCGGNDGEQEYECVLFKETFKGSGYWTEIPISNSGQLFYGSTREDACAKALLWIKEDKHGEM